jgi:hypothetical protein
VQSQVRFNRVPEKVLETEPGQVQQVSEKVRGRVNRVPKRVPGGFGAEPGQVQQGSEKGSRKPWRKAKSSSTGFRRTFRRRSGRLWCVWCVARSGSTGFRRRFWKRSGRLSCRATPGQEVPVKVWEALVQPGQVQQGSGEVSTTWLRSTLQKDL